MNNKNGEMKYSTFFFYEASSFMKLFPGNSFREISIITRIVSSNHSLYIEISSSILTDLGYPSFQTIEYDNMYNAF